MVTENDFVPFATGDGANVLSQADYLASPQLSPGQQPGVASSALNNKALRQATYMASCLAQFLVNQTGSEVLDDGNQDEVLATMGSLWPKFPPSVSVLTTGTTYGLPYTFQVVSANATAGATYTNNGATFTVSSTISGGLILITTGTGVPSAFGTLTKASGTGDSSIAFTAFTRPLFLKISMVGGGAGGGGGGNSGTSGSNGTASTFGTQLSAGGGAADSSFSGGAGGTASVGTVATCAPFGGGSGGSGGANNAISTYMAGGSGGNSMFGGGGAGGGVGGNGTAGATNTGGGGGGGGNTVSADSNSGGGGGSGAGITGIISGLLSNTYTYQVGSGGAGGTSGGTSTGGAGGNGIIIVEEHYQ